jgi:hypothetical protein
MSINYEELTRRVYTHVTGTEAQEAVLTAAREYAAHEYHQGFREGQRTDVVDGYTVELPPDWTAMVKPDDYRPGDVLRFLGTDHVVKGFEPMDPESPTAKRWPGTRVLLCTDGFAVTATPDALWPTPAGEAPPGYFERTGRALMKTPTDA